MCCYYAQFDVWYIQIKFTNPSELYPISEFHDHKWEKKIKLRREILPWNLSNPPSQQSKAHTLSSVRSLSLKLVRNLLIIFHYLTNVEKLGSCGYWFIYFTSSFAFFHLAGLISFLHIISLVIFMTWELTLFSLYFPLWATFFSLKQLKCTLIKIIEDGIYENACFGLFFLTNMNYCTSYTYEEISN